MQQNNLRAFCTMFPLTLVEKSKVLMNNSNPKFKNQKKFFLTIRITNRAHNIKNLGGRRENLKNSDRESTISGYCYGDER